MREGLLLVDFLQNGRTIDGKFYAELIEKLNRRIRRKWKNMEEEGIFLLHDNATPHILKFIMKCRINICQKINS